MGGESDKVVELGAAADRLGGQSLHSVNLLLLCQHGAVSNFNKRMLILEAIQPRWIFYLYF